ncbi:MAG: hypothetical protein JWR16_2516 [Nevskia sp.]|nr:hypothetical protein [Nevskia sp.]
MSDAESQRLAEDARREKRWKLWGTYLSERQWGTVREDYSADGDVWKSFPHDQARSRAYRWGEDGLLGFTDEHCRLCFAPALWNGRDPILKERLFGLTGPEGNHGEDVKELYWYLDATPTHSYCKALYRYPQAAYPYQQLVDENGRRNRNDREYELLDTGVLDAGYFDLLVEYAKAAPDDILIRLTVSNRSAAAATLHLLPTLWFRNTWSWGEIEEESIERPRMTQSADGLLAEHATLGAYRLRSEGADARARWLFTENETNTERLYGVANRQPYVKDAFHAAVIEGLDTAVNAAATGTKAALHCQFEVAANSSVTLKLRLSAASLALPQAFGRDFDAQFAQRVADADAFYAAQIESGLDDDKRRIARAAYAGLLWSKQFYNLVQSRWASGDETQPPPPLEHTQRNDAWPHLYTRDVLSMPDKWEFPYFCSWDMAFHCVSLSRVDVALSQHQLLLLLREWYAHRNGQLPAYEFNFSDVNPPVHPWAVWRVYRLPAPGQTPDRAFLQRGFQKLLLNFTWWVNREDAVGNNLFSGGFLGLDNIGVFDRSKPLPTGGRLLQADGTGWMAFYCIHMLSMALELASTDHVYEDLASKFLEHFGAITDAMNNIGGSGLWDEQDGFYYDRLQLADSSEPLRVRSIIGFIPMFASTIIKREGIAQFSGFVQRAQWNAKYRPLLSHHVIELSEGRKDFLLTVPSRPRLERMLARMFDEEEFLSPFGIRSLSKFHQRNPYVYHVNGVDYAINYEPGEGTTGMFGGNSNWRGPIWFPINFLILESLRVYHRFYGEDFKVEFPTRSGNWVTLGEAARRLAHRLQSLFLPDAQGRRPCHGDAQRYAEEADWKDLVLFNEYYHADSGRGCGASHQTGWTALIADLLNLEARWSEGARPA